MLAGYDSTRIKVREGVIARYMNLDVIIDFDKDSCIIAIEIV